MRHFAHFILVFFGFLSCSSPTPDASINTSVPPVVTPHDNFTTPQKVLLGRHLFYDPVLSIDSSISCASCHLQEYAFADTTGVSIGFNHQKGFRNTTTLTNVGYATQFFKEGGVKTLERAVHPPILTDVEMNSNAAIIEKRLNKNPQYQSLFQDAFSTRPSYKGAVYALAAFQRTLFSFNTPYDAYMRGDSTALSEAEKRGLTLFKSARLNCVSCHVEPFFWDDNFHNIGLYQVYKDYGRGRFTLDSADYGKMKTPTLRNIAVTWPYMHDGSIQTLEEVINFYQTGGKNHPNKSTEIVSFTLTAQERLDLISFLKALTDSSFLTNEALSSPF